MGSRKEYYEKERTLNLCGTSRMGKLFSRIFFYKQREDVGRSIRNIDATSLIYRRIRQ
jgi:hypothetical protein